MRANVTLDLLGASSIARQVFGAATRRYRDLVPILRAQGWPITEVDGRPAANSDLLRRETAKRLTGGKADSTENVIA
jgi:hypothetical protein